MLAIGGLLVAIALLTLAVLAPVFRRENPPRWTTRGWIGEVVTLAIVCTLAAASAISAPARSPPCRRASITSNSACSARSWLAWSWRGAS